MFGIKKFKKELNEVAVPQIDLVLDIDGTIASGLTGGDLSSLLVKHPFLQYFSDKNLIIDAKLPHFLHPGVVEFIQWIFLIPNVKLSFYSNGVKERNQLFVRELLLRALGKEGEALISTIPVYTNARTFLKCTADTKKKDLRKIFKEKNLNNVILIEDSTCNIVFGQERNGLLTKNANVASFSTLEQPELYWPQMEAHIWEVNHIFYIVGVLKKLFSMKKNCLADNLLNLQYTIDKNGEYKQVFELYEDQQYYQDGLAELRKLNSSLEFYGGEKAVNCFKMDINPAPALIPVLA